MSIIAFLCINLKNFPNFSVSQGGPDPNFSSQGGLSPQINVWQGSFFTNNWEKYCNISKNLFFFSKNKIKGTMFVCSPFKIAFYHLGAMVHIETNCYNTSRSNLLCSIFFPRKFMYVYELYIFFNQKFLHLKKHTPKLYKCYTGQLKWKKVWNKYLVKLSENFW